ncbi:MAG: CPBP family intramembrane metalloprotease [Lachnospiraceae bacterium]|nr:CPBP family intramembrane metalloprotease [Lachnospiraceae bacterium]
MKGLIARPREKGEVLQEENRKVAFGRKEAFCMLLLGAVIGIGLNLAFSALGITEASESFKRTAGEQFSKPLAEALLLYGIGAPLLEEVIFRKGVYGLIRRFTGFTTAMIVSAAVFGIYHGNVVQGLYAFLMGLVMAVNYEKYKTLLAPIFFHSGANLAVCLFIYFSWMNL